MPAHLALLWLLIRLRLELSLRRLRQWITFRSGLRHAGNQEGRTLVAFSPLGLGLRSNETRWFSVRNLNPFA